MSDTNSHKILIVDNKERFEKIFGEIIKDETYAVTHEKTGESALKRVKKEKPPFSIILCEQELSGMQGNLFLENCLKANPHTRLYLMADDADVDAIINGVNKGAIHRYLERPLTPEEVKTAVDDGLKVYDFLKDTVRLMKLAKKQSAKLYQLSCELMENQKANEKTLNGLDLEIEQVKEETQNLSDKATANNDIFSPELTEFITLKDQASPERIQTLFDCTIKQLHSDFVDLAHRNGFEMPQHEGNDTAG